MYPLSFPVPVVIRLVTIALATLASTTPTSRGQTPQQRLHEAYYLEHARGNTAAAADLYRQVATGMNVPAELQAEAKNRLEACQEELATADFTRLMPPEPLAYLELNHPGARLRKLAAQLGLLADPSRPAAGGQKHLAISPAVIDALLGIRGLAVAITGFNPTAGQPSGVAVFHPGDVELIRGLIETALPLQSDNAESIGGYPTYRVQNVYVSLTKRLVIAGSSQAEIEAVIERLKSRDAESLATSTQLAEVLKQRDGALLFFCVNPKPLMPLVNVMLSGAAHSREVALAQALLDFQSFQSLAGRFDISDQGLLLELTLRLDEGHRNLVYNFLRRPAIDPQTLRCIPAGAAAFLALAMNEAPPAYRGVADTKANPRPVITALDIGREIFANINGIAICALPSLAGVPQASPAVPDVAAVITVNDPAKSQALWHQILGVASVAAGAPSMSGESREVAGVPTTSYSFQDKVTVHVATLGHELLITTSTAALEKSIQAKRESRSILDDSAFARPMKQLGANTTFAVAAHPGRCLELARQYMPPGAVAEMPPIAAVLQETTACLTVDHSDRMLRLGLVVAGVPDVSGLVSNMLAEQQRGDRAARALAKTLREED